jgi:cytosine/adenosine deaminase-related metal-dependent hydrolase
MRYFSAQYIFTNSGPPLKRAVICAEDDGTIVSVTDNNGILEEMHSVEFHNGIIVPGFINCHCHLELSWMKNKIEGGRGLGSFLSELNAVRTLNSSLNPENEIKAADRKMAEEGVVVCADICNTDSTFSIKTKSRIKYINLLEIYGIDPAKAEKRLEEIMRVSEKADEHRLEWYLVPHSVYSVSLPLFRSLKEKTMSNRITSVHFLESEDERDLISERSGRLMEAYSKILSPSSVINPAENHVSAVVNEITGSGSLILVHNTYISKEDIRQLGGRGALFFCLCPNSNLNIEGKLPPLSLLKNENCEVVIGTDGLSSNRELSMLSELRTLQEGFPEVKLEELIRFATLNGAKALNCSDLTGSIEPGKKPGLVLIKNVDFERMKLLPSTISARIL